MNIIDHRILIPTSPESVWTYIANIANIAEWQVNIEHTTLLTSPTSMPGQGMRWRSTLTNRREIVVMITAWYDRLGYEYTIVDGVNFKSNKGQIRLQEIAEGTIVQWTFQFESSGFFSSMRNSMGSKRQIEQNIIDSLRTLWKVIDHRREKRESFEARSLMRDAPDVEARANYKARYPTIFEARLEDEPESLTNVEDDTRPRGIEIPQSSPPSAEEDEMLQFAPPESQFRTDFKHSDNIELQPDDALSVFDKPVEPEQSEVVESEPLKVIELVHFDEVKPSPETDFQTGDVDTSKVSVFDLFGIQKPSETQEMRAITPEDEMSAPISVISSPDENTRAGLRVKLRRNSYKLRRPY